MDYMNICPTCGSFTRKKYCSAVCYQNRSKHSNCPICGKIIKRTEMTYCSRKCSLEGKHRRSLANKQVNTCLVCGSETYNKKYCNIDCWTIAAKTFYDFTDNLPKIGKTWTDEDRQYLSENYGLVPIDDLARHFNMSRAALCTAASRMGIRSHKKWKANEIEIIKKHIQNPQVLRDLLPTKSPSGIANLIKRITLEDTLYNYITSPETICKDFLDEMQIEYIREKSFHPYRTDFLVGNLDIEVHGTYFHGDPRFYREEDLNQRQIYKQKIDQDKEKYLKSIHGIDTMVLWEHDIYTRPDWCKQQIGVAVLKSRN